MDQFDPSDPNFVARCISEYGSLKESLSELTTRIRNVNSALLKGIANGSVNLDPPGIKWVFDFADDATGPRTIVSNSTQLFSRIYELLEEMNSLKLACEMLWFNFRFSNEEEKSEYSGKSPYEIKKVVASLINKHLRSKGIRIIHKKTGQPCIVYAVASRDGLGRYTLEDVNTKKRLGSHKSIKELLPAGIAGNAFDLFPDRA